MANRLKKSSGADEEVRKGIACRGNVRYNSVFDVCVLGVVRV